MTDENAKPAKKVVRKTVKKVVKKAPPAKPVRAAATGTPEPDETSTDTVAAGTGADAADTDAAAAEADTAAPESSGAAVPDAKLRAAKKQAAKRATKPVASAKPVVPQRRSVLPIVTGILAALTVLALAFGIFAYLRYTAERDEAKAHEEALNAACKYAPLLITFDAKNLDPFFADVAKEATGEWKQQWDKDTPLYREFLVATQTVSKANDTQCGVKSGTTDAVEVVVAVGRSVTTNTSQGEQPGQVGMVMRMEKIDGRWLAAKVEAPFLGAS